MRKGKKTEQTIEMTQQVEHIMRVQSFDLMLNFKNKADQPILYMDENVKLVIEGLLDLYGEITVKINWWGDGLKVIEHSGENALQGVQEVRTGTIDTDPIDTMH